MGAWGYGLLENDTAYDFISELDDMGKGLVFDRLLNEDPALADSFRESKEKIAQTVEGNDASVEIMVYVGFLLIYGIKLTDKDKLLFDKAYIESLERLGEWREPDARRKVLDKIKKAVDEETGEYSFEHEGLLDKMSKGE